jgi:hypothetical protein
VGNKVKRCDFGSIYFLRVRLPFGVRRCIGSRLAEKTWRIVSGLSSANLDDLDVLQHPGNFDLVAGNIAYDVVLPHPDPGHARQVRELVAVRIPDLCYVIQMLVRLPEISVIDYAIRPSLRRPFEAY